MRFPARQGSIEIPVNSEGQGYRHVQAQWWPRGGRTGAVVHLRDRRSVDTYLPSPECSKSTITRTFSRFHQTLLQTKILPCTDASLTFSVDVIMFKRGKNDEESCALLFASKLSICKTATRCIDYIILVPILRTRQVAQKFSLSKTVSVQNILLLG